MNLTKEQLTVCKALNIAPDEFAKGAIEAKNSQAARRDSDSVATTVCRNLNIAPADYQKTLLSERSGRE